jgi:hypothetical protein
MNWTAWLKGLLAAAIGGGAAGVAQVATPGSTTSLKTTGIVAGVSALTTVLAYLLKSPVKQ